MELNANILLKVIAVVKFSQVFQNSVIFSHLPMTSFER